MSVVCLSMWYADAGKHLAERALGLLGKVGVDRWIWSVRPSNDITAEMLRFIAGDDPRVEIFVEPEFQPSDRMERLSLAGDRMLGMVKDEDWVCWMESDLLSYPTAVESLAESAWKRGLAACGGWTYLSHADKHPLLVMNTPVQCKLPYSVHYDTWGYRRGGVRFRNTPPYHEDYPELGVDVVLGMDSVGSMVMIDGDYIRRGARMKGGALVGLCESIRSMGGTIGFDPKVPVVQPICTWTLQND